MSTRTTAFCVVAFAALCVVLPDRRTHAQVPEPAAVRWEYKVVAFGRKDARAKLEEVWTNQLNKLAGDGWEYVGVVSSNSTEQKLIGDTRSITTATFIAFRRTIHE